MSHAFHEPFKILIPGRILPIFKGELPGNYTTCHSSHRLKAEKNGRLNKTMLSIHIPRPLWAVIAAGVAVVFGLLTLFSGGSVLFIDGAARAAAGNYVPFVLWFNFVAGFAYVIAGLGLFFWRGWALLLAMSIAAVTLLVFAAFGLHILIGGSYEMRTIGAMSLRSAIWLAITAFAIGTWKKMLRSG